ncbi:hypothetical protein CUU62_27210 [Pseudomonas sp. WP001]|nr:hypothetical protein CUU62_27210 [Pseudomonas sp. WP001]
MFSLMMHAEPSESRCSRLAYNWSFKTNHIEGIGIELVAFQVNHYDIARIQYSSHRITHYWNR